MGLDSRWQFALFVGFAVLIASLNSLQARVNAELGFRTQDSLLSAFFSIGSGVLILAVVLFFSKTGRSGLRNVPIALAENRLRWWHLLGGVSGAFYAVAQTTTGIILGVALFSIAIVSGQTLSSLVVDRLGVGPSGIHKTTTPRILGTALVLAAVVISVGSQLNSGFSASVAIVPFIAGFAMGWQLAVNGRVRKESHSVLAATFINFSVAGVLLLAVVVLRAAAFGFPENLPTQLWLYTGGLLGAIFIAGAALVVARIGVLVLSVAVVAGQLIGAMMIDLVLPSPLHPLTLATAVGVALALVAVGISSVKKK